MPVQEFRERGTIQAIQWTKDNFDEVVAFVGTYTAPGGEERPAFQIAPRKVGGARIYSSDGYDYVRQGDWVVKRDGQYWPVGADAFHEAYEPDEKPKPKVQINFTSPPPASVVHVPVLPEGWLRR